MKMSDALISGNASDNSSSNTQPELLKPAAANAASYDLNKFYLDRVLNNNTRNKSIILLGRFQDVSATDRAIVIFEKEAFKESDVVATNCPITTTNASDDSQLLEKMKEDLKKSCYFCSDFNVQTEFINNIYGSYQCTPPAKLSGLKATVIYPATDKHIEKYSINNKYLVNETAELYQQITLPYINSRQFSLEWVYNILEHKQEAERIIFEDTDPETGFILLPDLKWDGRNVENLYVLAITHKRDIKSLRDLNASHLPLLRNIRHRAAEVIAKRYAILPTQLRMYFHYQPSFYHLHIHINPIRNDAPGIWCEKSHMLDTVINNLELLADYYLKASLPFVLYENDKLLDLYSTRLQINAVKRSANLDDYQERKKIRICDEPFNDEEVGEKVDEIV